MMDYSPTILTGGDTRSDDQIMEAHGRAARRVSGSGLPGAEDSPLVIMELLQRLRVRDVMRARDIISVIRSDSLRFAQNLMKRNNISGVPVVENRRLFGIVSVNDIIRALEGGWIHDTCQQHMATNLVVLEEDMPLAFAIKYFENYTFGRFPVLNKERDLVGIVSQRDVMRAIMKELTDELARLEGRTPPPGAAAAAKGEGALPYYSMRQFAVVHNDLTNAGKAANEIKRMLKEAGVDKKIIRRKDSGPGIKDVEWACRDGTSTANDWIRSMGFGAGMGLANSKRVADTFEITSKIPTGTWSSRP